MGRLQELIEVLSDQNVQARTFHAKRTRVCKICQKSAEVFDSPSSRVEYQLSTICESCQKYYYNVSD